ncbi:hypothetical protein V8E55_006936 [Tylopilus felleus]
MKELHARKLSGRWRYINSRYSGMKLLPIQEGNGFGIRKSDPPILAEWFTTSKIKSFSDLSRLTTFGFRATLASISHVAHVSVVTRTKTDSCA